MAVLEIPRPRLLHTDVTPQRRTIPINETTRLLNDETTRVKLRVMPSVVSVITYEQQVSQNGDIRAQEKGVGSGFIIAPNIIATNRHVVEESQKDTFEGIAVATSETAPDGSPRKAQILKHTTILYASPDSDVAFVGIDPQEHPEVILPPVDLGSIRDVQAGDRIMTFGIPWNLPNTIAVGHVAHDGIFAIEGDKSPYVQIDASTRPGNSGGPAVNLESGAVVGVTTARLQDDATTGLIIPIEVFIEEFEKWQKMMKSSDSPSGQAI